MFAFCLQVLSIITTGINNVYPGGLKWNCLRSLFAIQCTLSLKTLNCTKHKHKLHKRIEKTKCCAKQVGIYFKVSHYMHY